MGLAARLGWRLLGALTVLWGIATLSFFAVRLIPGDPALAVLGGPGSNATAEAVEKVRGDYGFDRPLLVQYTMMLGRLVQLDLGESYRLHTPVIDHIAALFAPTLTVALLALVVAWVLTIPLCWWATRPARYGAIVADLIGMITSALPHFWLGAVGITLFVAVWKLPIVLASSRPEGLILPVLTLAIPLAGYLAQVTRDGMEDALDSQFVLAARARGESEWHVFTRHVLRHGIRPAIHLTGWAFGSLIGGAVVIEQMFARTGLGRSLIDAVTSRDVPLVTGVLMVVAVGYVLVTLVTELVEWTLYRNERPVRPNRKAVL
ncbi:MAG: ABC transporter permease [Actinomycetaceae bacterium]|nr:ABC transporter permease [Actinomycetaceae bacterium]